MRSRTRPGTPGARLVTECGWLVTDAADPSRRNDPLMKGASMELLLRADAVATIARDRADAPGLEGSGGTLNEPACPLRVLFLVSAHNGLSQRALIALRDLGHEVTVAVVDGAGAMEAAVRQHDP